jgi:hypothetical protein
VRHDAEAVAVESGEDGRGIDLVGISGGRLQREILPGESGCR